MSNKNLPVTPAGHRLLILMDEVRKGELYLLASTNDVESERKFGTRGTVVALGDSCYNLEHHGKPWVKPGDRVIIKEYEGIHFIDEETDKLYRLVNDEAIVGILNK